MFSISHSERLCVIWEQKRRSHLLHGLRALESLTSEHGGTVVKSIERVYRWWRVEKKRR